MQNTSVLLTAQARKNATAVAALVFLLFPSSASVLCIGPGGHAAIEDIGSACCAGSVSAVRGDLRPHNGLAAAGDCHNCTDIFLTPNGRGGTMNSRSDFAPTSAFGAIPGTHIVPDALPSVQASAAQEKLNPSVVVPPSVPLLC